MFLKLFEYIPILSFKINSQSSKAWVESTFVVNFIFTTLEVSSTK
uniref:Uncharacterized protein n=1 Tax=Anguilla anguilla TaxID=7936 RepID=A0A0E9U5R0_ANGAN